MDTPARLIVADRNGTAGYSSDMDDPMAYLLENNAWGSFWDYVEDEELSYDALIAQITLTANAAWNPTAYTVQAAAERQTAIREEVQTLRQHEGAAGQADPL